MTTTLETRRSDAVTWTLRLLGALLLAAMAAIHGYLWQSGYDDIAVIGPSFVLNTVLGGLGALALVLVGRRRLPWAAAAGAALSAGSLAALILSTTVGLFGFVESTSALLWWESFWIEAAAVVVLALLTWRVIGRER